MSILGSALILVLGLALIIKGGEWFVAAAVRIAEFLRMPRIVIGSTLVSLATTTPELSVAVMAGLHDESGLAVGNAVGSCICNIGLILGVTAALKHVEVHLRALRVSLVIMFAVAVALLLMTLDLRLSRLQGTILVLAGLSYFALDFWIHYRDRKPCDLAESAAIEKAVTATRIHWLQTRFGAAIQFSGGALLVVLGSRLLVKGAVDIAVLFSIPPIVIGLTVVAIGTSLPELVTAVSSSRQSVSDLAVGNVLGANIANLTLIVGAAAMIHEVRIDRATQLLNFPAMIGLMVMLVWMLSSDRRVTRREGTVLLLAYAAYIVGVILMTVKYR